MQENQNSVIQPDLTTNSITGKSGAVYLIHDSISTGRYAKLEAFEAEIETGSSVNTVLRQIRAAYEALNKTKIADASVILNNAINHAEKIDTGRVNTLILACTLFICKPGEQLNEWSESEAIETVKDWTDIDPRFFLNCWARFQTAYMSGYGSQTWGNLEEKEAGKDEPQNPQ